MLIAQIKKGVCDICGLDVDVCPQCDMKFQDGETIHCYSGEMMPSGDYDVYHAHRGCEILHEVEET